MDNNYTLITNKHSTFRQSLKELFQFRDLILLLSFRDFKIKYAQTSLGVLWALISPIITLLILFVVFGKIANVDTGIIPHPLYILSGLIGWNYFATVVNQSAKAFLLSQAMIQKIYFPRLTLILSKAVSGLVEFVIVLLLIAICFVYYGTGLSINILFLPFFIILFVLAALTFGIWVSALSVRYRDIHHIIPFFIQLGLFITPIAYSKENIPENFIWLYYINPMAILIDGFRWCLFDIAFDINLLLYAIAALCLMLYLGLKYFNYATRLVADLI